MFGIINFAAFLIAGVLLNLTPGSDTMYILGRSISQGKKAGLLSALGDDRIRSAKNWIKIYSGKNIVKGYSKKYSVDMLCAVKELRMIGYNVSEEYEKQLHQSLQCLRSQRLSSKIKREDGVKARIGFDSDENFAMILGYTSGGLPYGVTHEEMDTGDLV